MKNFSLFLFGWILLIGNPLLAQTETPKASEDKVYEMFDISKQPVFPGGESAMMTYISQNLRYPALAREQAITGTVAITFVIEKDGTVKNAQIIKDIGGGCGKESVRVVESMPKWTPGEAKGVPVKVRYTLPIRFRLDDNSRSAAPGPSSEKKALSTMQVWQFVAQAANAVVNHEEGIVRTSLFDSRTANDQKLLLAIEKAFETTLSESDKKGIKNLGQLADYCYKAQFAPDFFMLAEFKGRHARLLSNRANFDANADGLGQLGSIRIPKGLRVILYSKKNFKGDKLELNAEKDSLEIPDLNNLSANSEQDNKSGKSVNWSVNTQSVKVILPKGFAEEK